MPILPRSGRRTRGSPQKIVLQFLGGRSLERIDLATLRIYAGHDVLDGAVFSRGVHGLQDQQDGPAILGIEFFLQPGETRDPALERFFRVLFGFHAERFPRIEILQAEMRSIRDPERLHIFAWFHDCAMSFLLEFFRAIHFCLPGKPDNDPVQLFRHFDLATQPAVLFRPFRGDAQHEFLIVRCRGNPVEKREIHIDMAGGAHAIARRIRREFPRPCDSAPPA